MYQISIESLAGSQTGNQYKIPDICIRIYSSRLQGKYFSVIRDKKIPVIEFKSFSYVILFSVCKVFVFRMPQYKIRNMQFFCQTTGIHNGAVVLFIRFENITLAVRTEGLMEKPVRSLDIGKQGFTVRFITYSSPFFMAKQVL